MLLASLMIVGGCAYSSSPVIAPLVLNEKGPVGVGSTDLKATKQGIASSEGIIIVGWGDSSIAAAAAQNGITKIHHVDTETQNIFGIYSKYTTVVYGE